jgi:hypothetical protein
MLKILIFILVSCDTSNIRKNYPIDQTAQLIKRQGGYISYNISKDLNNKNLNTEENRNITTSEKHGVEKRYCIESYVYSIYPVEKNDNNVISTHQIRKNNNIYKYNIIFNEKDFITKAFIMDKNFYKLDNDESFIFQEKLNSVCN